MPPAPPLDRPAEGRSGDAFDLWLQRGLHQLFDGVAREPIPEELLRLIEDDRVSGRPAAVDGAAPAARAPRNGRGGPSERGEQ